MKPFLILQLRPEPEASDDEFAAILSKGGLAPSEVRRYELARDRLPEDLDPADFAGTIVGGGPGCVSDAPERKSATDRLIESQVFGLMPRITDRDLPFLGCCYGIGVLAHHLGGLVSKARYGEPVGATTCVKTDDGRADPLLADLPERFDAFVGHKEAVQMLPPGCVQLLRSDPCPFQMIRHGQNVYATQFHPEADADGLALRIRVYRDKGYFPPEDAERLTEMARGAGVHLPERLLRAFVARYG